MSGLLFLGSFFLHFPSSMPLINYLLHGAYRSRIMGKHHISEDVIIIISFIFSLDNCLHPASYPTTNFINILLKLTHTKKRDNKKYSEYTDTSTSVTMTCVFDLMSRSRKIMSLDVAYCIVPWYQV